jgi:uncharacterized membrane protein
MGQTETSEGTEAGMATLASVRAAVAFFVGGVVGLAAAFFAPWQLTVLLAFEAFGLTQLVWVWLALHDLDGDQTKAEARREDNSRLTTSAVVITACFSSLVGVVLALVKAKQAGGAMNVVLTVAAVLAVVLAWCILHATFTLRYAHLYYRAMPGGVDFNDPAPPDYRDFAYLGFTVGMTYQVSDTDISDRAIRRTITHHSLISFVFGTVIIGLTINVIAGLIR